LTGEEIVNASCKTHDCKNQPAFTVFWPGQTGIMCGPCCLRAIDIANAMGFSLDFRVLEPDLEDVRIER
jgi:hypothetical protein